jgi:hypothetical protein
LRLGAVNRDARNQNENHKEPAHGAAKSFHALSCSTNAPSVSMPMTRLPALPIHAQSGCVEGRSCVG